MDAIIRAVVLGVVQGIAEFLPISSSAHLIIVRYLFNFPEMSQAFDVALHFGTLIAVLVIYFKDWLAYLKAVFNKIVKKEDSRENNMFWYLVVATIPGALIGMLLEGTIEEKIRSNYLLIAILLAVMGVLIYLGDRWASKKYKDPESFEKITFKQAVIIGCSQALAIIPGFSRSGTTILAARLMGISREAAAKFTFLLSTPIICGAAILKLDELILGFGIDVIVGIVVAALVGIVSIKFLLRYVKDKSFAVFSYWRIFIAIVVIAKLILA